MEPINRKPATSIIKDTKHTGQDGVELVNGVLPLSRVKKLIKMSANSANVSAGSCKLIQLVSEEYLRAFVRHAKTRAEEAGRKTIQPKDLDRVIKDDYAFSLLEDTLTDWPNDADAAKQPTIQQSIAF